MSDTVIESSLADDAPASAPVRSDPAASPDGVRDRPEPRSRPAWLLAVVLVGQFMAILDVSIVNVAAPTIRTDLHASGAGLQMVIAGYTIAYAILLITGARLGDMVGARRAFLAGLGVFTAASLACGLAGSAAVLIGFRFVQGAGAALMVPQVLSLIQRSFAGAARARALSAYAAVIAGGVVVGQVVGGALVDADLWGTGWRPVFLVNVPIGVALVVLGRRLLPVDGGRRDRELDVPGLVALSAAVLLLVVPLVLGHELDWPAWGWAMLAASVVVFAGFAVVERRLARRGGSPLIPPPVLRAPGLAVGALVIFLAMSTYGGFLFSMALHLQSGLGDSPLRAGLTFAPAAVGFAATSLSWQRAPERWHRRLVPAGLAVTAVAYGVIALVTSGGDRGGVALPLALALVGLGMGAAYSPVLSVALRHVSPVHAPDASGVLVTLTQLGQVVGVATFGTLFLGLVDGERVPPTAHAIAVTGVALAATAGLAAAAGLRIATRRQGTISRPD